MARIETASHIAHIRLQGEPYQSVLPSGEVIDASNSLDILARSTQYARTLEQRVAESDEHLDTLLNQDGYYTLDRALKNGQDLTFSEAFSLIAFVCSALNAPLLNLLQDKISKLGPLETHTLQAVALLSGMSHKESYAQLNPAEIAGMVAATLHLDTVARVSRPDPLLAFGGMGGDTGYPLGSGLSKLFSLSTLSAVASAVVGPTHKHHSYPNTSKIAGQSAIEAFGARSDFHSLAAFSGVFDEANLLMTSCHNTRTLHTLSHLLRGETINHVIGPLAFTLAAETPVHGFIGVNEKVHPETMLEALLILDQRGYQRYENSAVFCGTNQQVIDPRLLSPETYYGSRQAKNGVCLDEVAPPPYASLAAFSVAGVNQGTFSLYPSDFYTLQELKNISFQDLVIPNTKDDILHFNNQALRGADFPKSMYLAMTIGLGIFVRTSLGLPDALDRKTRRVNPALLRRATKEGLELILSRKAEQKLHEYVSATQRNAGGNGEV